MKLLFLSILFLFLLHITAAAQNLYAVKGSVADTASNHQLTNASVSVLQNRDSILVNFTQVNENGTFSITGLPKGKLFLLVTYPGYADYVEQFSLDSTKKSVDFGRIKMILKATLLNNVIIKGKAAAIKIKGDTTEFNAAAFVIQPNSKVEDLLKQLPGIQVDKDGKITAQGQTVTKVLVDGEEFFGDDPTLVTKNLRGDMVDKVQLYDKKSDQATFTGIDDGKTDKTINIKLKEDKKNGYFGKMELSDATGKYYEEQGMFNYFKGKQKFSAYGTLANTGKIGLGWEDSNKYGTTQVEAFDGGFYINGSNDDLDSFDGHYNDQGIPVARTGGTHYDAKWNDDKESVNANYKAGSLGVIGTNNTITQNNLPTGAFNTKSANDFNNFMFRQKLDGSYQIKPDTSSTLKISVDGTIKNSQTRSDIDTKSTRDNDVLLNESQRNLDNDAHTKLFNSRLFYTRKFKKPRRTLSVTLTETLTNTETKGYLKSDNEYYDATGIRDSSSVVNQYKTSLLKSSVFTSNIAYTEPLAKYASLVVNYGVGLNNSSADRQSFNPAANGNYTSLDTTYSNNFKLNQVYNQGGVMLNFKNNKHTLNFGSRVSNISFDQTNLLDNSTLKRNFLSWKPQLTYNYKFSAQSVIYVNYSGTGIQPTLDQIQPVRVNNDPLNIILGNPDLKQSFQNYINVRYSSNKVITGRNIYAYANYSSNSNPIVSNVVTDSAGRSVLSYTNLQHKKSSTLYGYFNINQKIKSLDISTGLSLNANGNTSYSYINGTLNKVKAATYGGNFNFYKSAENKYDLNANFGPTYTTNESSIQQQLNDNGWGWKANGGFTIYLPGKVEVGSDVRYEYRAKTESFDTNFSRVILNAAVSKKFLKSQGLKLSLSGNDLLNQNKGFSRSASGNMITQNDYTTIKRYFMGSISWDFSKMGGSTKKKTMNRKTTLLILLFISISTVLTAQNVRFLKEGIITYERTINTYAVMEKKMGKNDNAFKGPIMDGFKRSQSQFKTLQSTLYFSKNQTLFKPVADNSPAINYYGPTPEFTQLNTIFSDLTTRQQVTQKNAFEEVFLLKDNARKIKWKITTETREIAGYSCRRANAIVLDSIYVVAFYTEQIPVSGGPESFNGLPGMILGVALPHENVTWFAKTVTDKAVDSKIMVAPSKGKVTDIKGLTATLLAALKNWGENSNSMLKILLL